MNSRFLFSFRWFSLFTAEGFSVPEHYIRLKSLNVVNCCQEGFSNTSLSYLNLTLFTKITTISLPQLTGNPVSYRTWKNESTTYRRRSAKEETGVLNFQRRVGRNSVEWRQFCWTPRKNESSAKLCLQCSAMRKSAETGRPLQILHQAENLFLCSLCCQRHYHPARLRLLRCVFRPVVRQRYDFGQFPVKVISESGG